MSITTSLVARRTWALGGLVILHWALVGGFALTVQHNGWAYYQGGDQIWLMSTGWLLGDGVLAPTYIGYGWALVLAPISWITGAGYLAAMPLVAAFNVLLLAPAAILALYGLAARVAGPVFGLVAAAVWVVTPVAVIPLWRDDYHDRYVEQFLPQALGLSALADYPSLVLLLVSAYLFVRVLETRAPLDAVASGLVAGFALGVKPSNAIFLAAPVLAALAARRLRPLLPFALALLPAALTLAIWKQRGLGALPLFALEEARVAAGVALSAPMAITLPNVDRYLNVDLDVLRDNFAHLREYFWSVRVLQWLPIAGVVGLARRSPSVAALVGGWFGLYLFLKGANTLSTVAAGSFFRMLLPALPAYLLLTAGIVLLVPTLGARVATRWSPPPLRPVSHPVVVTLAVALAVVPAAAAALARPMAQPDAIRVNGILTPVHTGISVEVGREGVARVVRWAHGDIGRGSVFYRVYRTAAGGADLSCAEGAPVVDCQLEMLLLGTTREQTWRDGSPPAGAEYRIGIGTNWLDDAEGGDVFLISPPAPAG
ncbi:MAG TPA: hypothetical protein VNT58_02345 [Gaiellaceae bacterium]|nr:hypothetical protein [Gaiellaceae bacterium]